VFITELINATDFEGTHTHTQRDHLTTLAVCEAVFWKPSLLAGGMVKTHVLLKESTHTHCQRVFFVFENCPSLLPKTAIGLTSHFRCLCLCSL